jgi:uncharacterized coiled-coil protein SlyX
VRLQSETITAQNLELEQLRTEVRQLREKLNEAS